MTQVRCSLQNERIANKAWMEIFLQSFPNIGVLFALMLALSFPINAVAVPLQIAGHYSGQINGSPISATASGQIDTSGASLNHFTLEFQSIPSSINPMLAAMSWNSSYHGSALLPTGGAVNLFDLSAGNYTASRTVLWPSLPGDQLVLTANVSTANGTMTATTNVSGTYSGPADLIGVTDYKMLWTQISPTSIEVISTATILQANGESFGAQITSVFSGLFSQMPTNQQAGTYTFSNELFNNNTLSFDWQGTIAPVPVPAAFFLFGGGLVGVLGLALRKTPNLGRVRVVPCQ